MNYMFLNVFFIISAIVLIICGYWFGYYQGFLKGYDKGYSDAKAQKNK